MQISNTYMQGVAGDWARKTASQEAAQAKKGNASKSSAKAGNKDGDSVTVSGGAAKSRDVSATMLASRAAALPEIREEKVAIAHERIESGYYNTNEFNKELASRLVDG